MNLLDSIATIIKYLERRGYFIPLPVIYRKPEKIVENAEKVFQAENEHKPLPVLKWS